MKRLFPALLCLLASFAMADTSAKFGTFSIGSVVPEIKAIDADGRETLLPARGTVTVLSIMGTNRSPGDTLESAFSKYRGDGVTVIGICAGATREEFEAWRSKHKSQVSYPLLWDPAGKNRAEAIAQRIFGVATYPMTAVIDRTGKLAGGFVGFGGSAGLVLRAQLREAGVAIPPEEQPKGPIALPPPEDRTLKPGTPAPDFASVTLDGRTVKLTDFAGKIVVLDFWATWCGPCIASMPHTQQIAAATKTKDVVVLAACTSDTRAKFEAWVREHGTKYPDLIFANDPNGRDVAPEKYAERASAKLYGVTGIPCQFVIGRDGKIVDVIRGYGQGDTRLEETLANLGVKRGH